MTHILSFATELQAADSEPEHALKQPLGMEDFKSLYLKWLSPVYRYFYFRVGNAADAEDLASQVFLKVCEKLPHYHEQGHFPAWLFTIARNQAASYFRAKRHNSSFEYAESSDESNDLLSQAALSDEKRFLQQIIHDLPARDQELINLRYVVRLNYREIGKLLNQNEDAVRKSTTRLLQRLQSRLEEHHE